MRWMLRKLLAIRQVSITSLLGFSIKGAKALAWQTLRVKPLRLSKHRSLEKITSFIFQQCLSTNESVALQIAVQWSATAWKNYRLAVRCRLIRRRIVRDSATWLCRTPAFVHRSRKTGKRPVLCSRGSRLTRFVEACVAYLPRVAMDTQLEWGVKVTRWFICVQCESVASGGFAVLIHGANGVLQLATCHTVDLRTRKNKLRSEE